MRTGGSRRAAFLPPRPKRTPLSTGRPLRPWLQAGGGRTGNARGPACRSPASRDDRADRGRVARSVRQKRAPWAKWAAPDAWRNTLFVGFGRSEVRIVDLYLPPAGSRD